jgi:DNA-directed RNA polymerase subunit K/omega
MVQRPIQLDAFEFAVLASLRVLQLRRGCTPRVAHSDKITVTAQMEVAEGKVVALPRTHPAVDVLLPSAVTAA